MAVVVVVAVTSSGGGSRGDGAPVTIYMAYSGAQ